MYNVRLLAASALFALGFSCFPARGASPDASFTISVNGSLGKVLAGSDPVGGSGKSGVIDVKVSETLSPVAHTATSATYRLPVGSVTIGGKSAGGTPTMMKISTPAKGPVTIFCSGNVNVSGFTTHVTATVVLAHGSFPASVLKHPAPFKSPQTLTPATRAGAVGNKVSYTAGGTTVIALSGTISD
jgi:hypothetical protein